MGRASRRKEKAPGEAPAPVPQGPGSAPAPPAAAGGGAPAGWMTRPLAIVLAAAALFRAAYFLQYRAESVFFGTPFLDAWIYDDWARRIAAGAWVPAEPFYFAPGYPYLLAVFYRFVSPSLEALYVFQFLLGLLGIVLIHRLGALAFGRRAATIAASLAALYASFPFLEAKVMSATAALVTLLGAAVLLAGNAARRAPLPAIAAGLLLGATSLIRPETLLTAPFLLFWIWRAAASEEGGAGPPAGGRARRAGIASALLLAGWALPILPVAIHNARTGGGSMLISSQGGITFYQSNNPRARGLYVYLSRDGFSGAPEKQAREEKEIAEKALGRPLARSEVSSYWFGRGIDFILDQPGRFVWLLGMKLLRFVGSYEYSTEYILYVERETVWILRLAAVPFALLVALAIPSIVRLLRESAGGRRAARRRARPNPAAELLLLLLAANLATVLMFYVSSRYRLPSVPPLIVFAAATCSGLLEKWRAGLRTEVGVTAAAVAVLFVVAHFEKDSSAVIQEANVHYNSGNLWSGKKEPARALAEYERAIAMDDSRYEFFYNRGNTLRDLGRPAEAAASYGEAARRRPQFANAHLRRGQMLLEAGDPAGAREALLRAAELRPDDFEAHLGLGRAAARSGDREAAIRHLDRALEIRPDSQAAREERSRL